MRKVFVTVLLILIWQQFYNQSFDYLYNGEYNEAIECLEKAKKLNPDNPLICLRLTFAFWLKAEYGKNSKKDIEKLKEMFDEEFNKGVALCNLDTFNPENLFYLGGLYGNRVFFKQAVGQRNSSMKDDTEKSREYLMKIKDTEDFYYEASGYLGIFNYGPVLMSGIQKFIVKRFGYKWDEALGLAQIKDAINYSRYSDDIKFLYKRILMDLMKKKKHQDRIQEAIDLVNDLVARYPRNSILKNDLKILEELLQK